MINNETKTGVCRLQFHLKVGRELNSDFVARPMAFSRTRSDANKQGSSGKSHKQ